jgi:hypothetical protein
MQSSFHNHSQYKIWFNNRRISPNNYLHKQFLGGNCMKRNLYALVSAFIIFTFPSLSLAQNNIALFQDKAVDSGRLDLGPLLPQSDELPGPEYMMTDKAGSAQPVRPTVKPGKPQTTVRPNAEPPRESAETGPLKNQPESRIDKAAKTLDFIKGCWVNVKSGNHNLSELDTNVLNREYCFGANMRGVIINTCSGNFTFTINSGGKVIMSNMQVSCDIADLVQSTMTCQKAGDALFCEARGTYGGRQLLWQVNMRRK